MRRLGGSSLGEEGGVRRCCWGVKKERKWFCLQFGHPGGVEAHGHTGGASSVTHLPQHPAPLLLIILVPNEKRRVRSGEQTQWEPTKTRKSWSIIGGDLLPDVSDLCGSHLLALRLDHGEAAHGVQGAAVAQQVDGASLLGEVCEGLPPEEKQHKEKVRCKMELLLFSGVL